MSNTILVYRVGQVEPQVEQLQPGLDTIYTIIEGDLFQAVPFAPSADGKTDLEVICYEESKFYPLQYPRNRKFGPHDELWGTFFISKTDPNTGETASLTEADMEIAKAFFAGKELF